MKTRNEKKTSMQFNAKIEQNRKSAQSYAFIYKTLSL